MSALVTPNDVRFFLMDRTAQENFLLDSVEFSDEDVNSALTLAVDKYNSTLPMVDSYTTETFPYRYELMLGASASLLRAKGFNYLRNNLDFATKDGTVVNDRSKGGDYLKLADAMMQEFDNRITQIKKTKNAEQAYGHISGVYGRRVLW